MEADFGGWATKANLKCSDGLTIMKGAFEHMDKMQVPLVYQHMHKDINNVLGHAILEARPEGVYAHAFFNDTPQGQNAKTMVLHEDLKHLSIFANNLTKQGKNVTHGQIREVSLVLAGANPGAVIDFLNIKHGDGDITVSEEEAIITTEEEIEHSSDDSGDGQDDGAAGSDEGSTADEGTDNNDDDNLNHADISGMTTDDVWNSMDEKQQNLATYLVAKAIESAGSGGTAQHSQDATEGDLIHQEGADTMARNNVFDQTKDKADGPTLSHDDMKEIFADAKKRGSLKAAVENYLQNNADALQHGIESIDILFPDAKMATGVIELDKRRTEWVANVLNGTRHTPFSRIKTFSADLTQDAARAKGYIKGNYKLEEWIRVTKRTTSPTTVYKKQKLDRDDMLDITDFDIVAFLKGEMRLMTEEEIARAILIGDGRLITDEDKVKDPAGETDGTGIRSILNDHELFVTVLNVNVTSANYDEAVVDSVMDGMEFYKGTGSPTFYTTIPELNKFLKARDEMGRRLYANRQEVADALGVSSIVTVEVMKEVTDLVGIIVNLDDYNVGTDQGGELTMFDDFDIDYNQQKYLLETRLSGALIKPKTALVIKKVTAANLVKPTEPGFNAVTGVITIPTQTGVVYKDSGGTTLTAGAQTALDPGETYTVTAVPASTYYFANNQEDDWEFRRNDA